jgi:hypothetical protein
MEEKEERGERAARKNQEGKGATDLHGKTREGATGFHIETR